MAHLILLLSLITSSSFASVLNVRISEEPPGIDWQRTFDASSARWMYQIMEGLTSLDEKTEVQPGLAIKWSISKDRRTYVFHLRKGVKWSDGVPLTAQHFADAWERLLNPKTGAPDPELLLDMVGAKDYYHGALKDSARLGFKVRDQHTIEVTTNHPVPYFPALVSHYMTFPIRKDLIEKYGDKWSAPENLVVLGPYKLAEWKTSKIVFKANANYYGGAPKIEQINVLVLAEDVTAINLFETGSLDLVIGAAAKNIEPYKGKATYQSFKTGRTHYLGFNVTKKPFDSPLVRKAFAHATNRDQIVKVLGGNRAPLMSWVPEGLVGYDQGTGLSFDPALAKKYLAEAGYPEGRGFPETTIEFSSTEENRILAERLQANWKDVLGVQLRIHTEDWKTYLSRLRTDAPPVFRLSWGMMYPDPSNYLAIFESGSGSNFPRWKSADFDKLVAQADGDSKVPRRAKLYQQAQKYLLEKDTAVVPTFIDRYNFLVTPAIKGFHMNMTERFYLKKVSLESVNEPNRVH